MTYQALRFVLSLIISHFPSKQIHIFAFNDVINQKIWIRWNLSIHHFIWKLSPWFAIFHPFMCCTAQKLTTTGNFDLFSQAQFSETIPRSRQFIFYVHFQWFSKWVLSYYNALFDYFNALFKKNLQQINMNGWSQN